MFWADQFVQQIKKQYKEKISSNNLLIIRDEKTASGRVHVGSLRGVVIHGIISEILNEEKIKNEFFFEINDFDPMDSLPVYLDKQEFEKYMGQPLYAVSSPNKKAKNYAEYFGQEFIDVINKIGFKPIYYRLSDLYKQGKFNDVIRLALENADEIRKIYKEVSGAVKEKDWLPLQVVCEKCGKIGTTKVISFDGENVEYVCKKDLVDWAKGCGYKGKISPFNGNAKLPWKVEWAAKFVVLNVDVEGAGKDHSTKGGSREIAEAICKKVFKRNPPFNIPYEFVQVAGKKMSASKGEGSASRDIADLLPPELLRFLLLSKDPKTVIDFIPDGDTIPILYDNYDKMADAYFKNTEDDYERLFYLSHSPEQRKEIKKRFLPRFSQIAFLSQMPHMDILKEAEKIKEASLVEDDKKEIEYRKNYATNWLNKYAPEDYKYELQEKETPQKAKELNLKQKEALRQLLAYIKSQTVLGGQLLHTELHKIKDETGINPRELFSAIYLSFLGKESGPKAGWFLSVLDKEFIEKRLKEVVSGK